MGKTGTELLALMASPAAGIGAFYPLTGRDAPGETCRSGIETGQAALMRAIPRTQLIAQMGDALATKCIVLVIEHLATKQFGHALCGRQHGIPGIQGRQGAGAGHATCTGGRSDRAGHRTARTDTGRGCAGTRRRSRSHAAPAYGNVVA